MAIGTIIRGILRIQKAFLKWQNSLASEDPVIMEGTDRSLESFTRESGCLCRILDLPLTNCDAQGQLFSLSPIGFSTSKLR